MPQLVPEIVYRTIEFDSCSDDLSLGMKFFTNIRLNILRIRHCNLIDLNRQTFANMNQLEKFHVENSTLKFVSGMTIGELFSTNSFENLKSLTLKQIHYDHHTSPLNFEYLLHQLPNLYRLELMNIHLDSYRHVQLSFIGRSLTYLSLTNTHQRTIYPLSSLRSLEKLLIRQLSSLFHDNSIFDSLESLTKLKYILFEHNQLKEIPLIRSKTIDDIDLSSNLLERIGPYSFSHLPQLRQLTLTNNPLKMIDRRAFCSLEHLQRLAIHIKHQTISPLNNCLLLDYPHLQIVQDPQTKLQCDCQLISIFKEKRENPPASINRLFQTNDRCVTNRSQTFHLYEFEQNERCSIDERCEFLTCQPELMVKTSEMSRICQAFYLNVVIVFILLLDSIRPIREH